MSRSNEIKSFIFLDTETTGLPAQENNETKITELCMVAVQASHLRLGVVPRVQNTLNICFNPSKVISKVAADITGFSNHLLEDVQEFSEETVALMNSFLSHSGQPVCLVAHNGNNFDYPILRTQINETQKPLAENVLCVDSLVMFREFHFEEMRSTKSMQQSSSVSRHPFKRAKLSFKLGDIYSRLTKRDTETSHQALGDTLMLLTCAATLGDKFVDWANRNAREFCQIPAMVPGK